MYFRVCPLCGAALDPSERCDCAEDEKKPLRCCNTETAVNETTGK